MNQSGTGRLYFPGLHGLRFSAAALVMMSHIEQLKNDEKLSNLNNVTFIGKSGDYGVSLFFVLSGFLITFLLLQEEKTTGTIDIRKFYTRRILRIWPLYYLLVLLGFFVLPYCMEASGLQNVLRTAYWQKLILFLFFLPNLSMVAFPQVPFTAQAWSIGTEEQFYLIWPVLLKKFKRVLPGMLLGIAGGIIIFRKSLFILRDHMADGMLKSCVSLFTEFLNTFNIECMAIGGLGGVGAVSPEKKNSGCRFQSAFSAVFVCRYRILTEHRAVWPCQIQACCQFIPFHLPHSEPCRKSCFFS